MNVCMALFVLAVLLPQVRPQSPKIPALLQAHAHNDYQHDRPLLKALEHGFTSVEADVYLVGSDLCVAHNLTGIRPGRTLRTLYLDPLRERAGRYGGRVYPDGSRFILLIDVKSEAGPTYRRLAEILADYAELVTSFGPDGRKDRAVSVIISGNRSLQAMSDDERRYAGCDGRLSDLEAEVSADLMPMISDHWGRHFTWRGDGPMPDDERQRLIDIVRQSHDRGRLVRFWATPDASSTAREAVWTELLAADVDLINTDDLDGLRRFLLDHGR